MFFGFGAALGILGEFWMVLVLMFIGGCWSFSARNKRRLATWWSDCMTVSGSRFAVCAISSAIGTTLKAAALVAIHHQHEGSLDSLEVSSLDCLLVSVSGRNCPQLRQSAQGEQAETLAVVGPFNPR